MSNSKHIDTLLCVIGYGLTCAIVEQIGTQRKYLTEEAQSNCDDILRAIRGQEGEGFHPNENYPKLLK